MTSISPLNNVHELGSFGNFEGKNSNEIITIKELKNFKIFQVVKYKTSKTNIKEYKIFDLNFPDDLKVSGNNDTRILWMGPNNWFIFSISEKLSEEISKNLTNNEFAITDLSHSKAIIELSGKNLKEVLKKGCPINFNELNITDTWFEDDRNDKRIHQYFRNGTDAYNFDKSMDYFGGGGLISTASDISKFFYLLFNNKVFKSPKTFNEMLKKYSYSTSSQMDYSLGIWEINIDGEKLYTHSGFWGTQVVYSPKHNLSISANYSKGWRGGMNAPIIKKVLKLIK